MSRTWSEENDTALWNSAQQYLKALTSDEGRYGLELFISPVCNQNCEYCYLVNHADQLYPKEYRDNETILKNLDIFIDFLIENDTIPTSLDLFTGEIWESTFGAQILKKLMRFLNTPTTNQLKSLTIPTNFSFIANDKARTMMEKYIEAFRFHGVNLTLSCSYDGPIIENVNRPFNNAKGRVDKSTAEYAETLFNWCIKYGYGFHPMVNAYSIEKWPEQIKWWIDQITGHDLNLYSYTMFLEVRNNEWTDEKIQNYLTYLNTFVDYAIEKVHKTDINDFLKNACDITDECNCSRPVARNYNAMSYTRSSLNKGCSVDRMMCIRLGDLAWVPCHRTSYEKLIYGRFKVNESNKIDGIQALNIPMYVAINSLTYKGHMKCDVCPIASICMRGCYGAQMEDSKEIFYPCDTVCELFMAKWLFLQEKYRRLCYESNVEIDPRVISHYESISAVVNKMEKEKKDKWMPIISKVLSKN